MIEKRTSPIIVLRILKKRAPQYNPNSLNCKKTKRRTIIAPAITVRPLKILDKVGRTLFNCSQRNFVAIEIEELLHSKNDQAILYYDLKFFKNLWGEAMVISPSLQLLSAVNRLCINKMCLLGCLTSKKEFITICWRNECGREEWFVDIEHLRSIIPKTDQNVTL